MDDDEFLYGSAEDRDAQQTETTIEAKDGAELEPAQKAASEESSSEEADSDSDVEFIIGSSESKAVAVDDKTKEQPAPGPEQASVPIFTQTTGLDINQVASYEGQPITQLSLEELKEKPWRLPGADISDYFNYGFDELSWLAYCSKQDKLRAEFNPSKLINDLIASGSIPPSLSGLLGGMPGGMPGANGQTPMPPPFMMGMPPFMAMPNMFGQKKDGAQQQQGTKLPSRPASNSTPEPGNKSGRAQGSQRDQADRDFETGSHQQSYRDRDERGGGGGGRRRRR
ncbi:hypothetical protein KL921_003864 [Ogataea angusta]|uniref:Pre-mRNA polyadenylation factor FIP1 n=1 Tax=Pichia angusta TaxID=870730 RepID=A0AAN6DCR9_PICAN|nr:uncharacterized protein KL928_004105 [Ogataea angusta]KAG7808782.1 hypothetical protein KL921_003864 [Ogataea angusta]KAG7817370.1 hypothetical protein KL928_004105 [Ogataea angusta]KAG7823687.1 hypothetical protein KL909_003084 [Ogataea angusta]KAG7828874.1 hypothetical protein KL920_003370 [Ogataea angusta]KAG7844683.1 hypothetical protein KL941_003423 [Ogataea angusta]